MNRVLTAAVLIPFALWVILGDHPGWVVTVVVALVAGLCFEEFRGLVAAFGLGAPGRWSYAAGIALLVTPRDAALAVVLVALAAMALETRQSDLSKSLPRAGALLLGVVYIFGAWRSGLELQRLNPHWLLYAMAINWIGDVSAYYVGSRFGRHKLAPGISPNKSWEGALASAVTGAVFGALYLGHFLPQVPWGETVALSLAVNAGGQIGDLAESALKRGARVKDSGTLLPGHGGALDRLDSTLFSMPLVLLYLQTFTPRG